MVKINKILWGIFIFMVLGIEGKAQEMKSPKNRVQFKYGLSQTLHFQQPVVLYTIICFEGCELIQQRAGLSSNFELSYYRYLSPRSEIKGGIGYAQHNFIELRKSLYIYDLNDYFETYIKFNYIIFDIGHRYWFFTHRKFNGFIENDLVYEKFHNDKYSTKGGLSIKSQLGVSISIFKQVEIQLNGFYKVALSNYTKTIDKKYFPYGYGVELGLSWRF